MSLAKLGMLYPQICVMFGLYVGHPPVRAPATSGTAGAYTCDVGTLLIRAGTSSKRLLLSISLPSHTMPSPASNIKATAVILGGTGELGTYNRVSLRTKN